MSIASTALNTDSVSFGLEYDGPALVDHEMDVRDLAPALLSTGSLYQELNRYMNPTAPNVAVNVRANSEGSFLVELKIVFETIGQVTLGQPSVASLVGLITGSGILIQLVRKRRNGREVTQTPVGNETVLLTFADDTSIEIPASILRASESVSIRHDLAEMVQPLNREGVETVTLRRETTEIARIEKSEVGDFAELLSTPAQELAVTEREMFLTIRTAGFASGRWTFTDGASSFTAVVRDEQFMNRVHSGEAFSELDVLRCRVRETQSRDQRGLHASIEVLEVLEHLPPAQGTFTLGPTDH
jgi:hypothetical protein